LLVDAQAMAGLAVFANKPDPSREFNGTESKKEILQKAIEKEKDSIVYYTGLKNLIPARAGQDKIYDIIKEEMHHVRILNQSLEWLEMA
jgi:rubrerythrin